MKVIEVNTAKEFASTFFGDPILKMAVNAAIDNAPTVDAVPVDKIIFHHILIDENGIPEVKLQFGERTLILRREDDPVDVREVVHGQWELYPSSMHRRCSICKMEYDRPKFNVRANYCPNCGAKMDGGNDHEA